jgi:PAS domain S-box-containing protein
MSSPPGIDFETLFARSPNPYVVVDRTLSLVWMNDAYLTVTMRRRDDIVGRKMFDAFPSDPDSESHRLLSGSLRRVLQSGEADELALIRYDIAAADGSMDERYWSATHTPLHDAEGSVAYILQHTVDVTELESLRRLRDEVHLVKRADAVQTRNSDLAQESERLRGLFEQAPGFVAVVAGADHVFQMVNAAYRTLAAQREVVGKSVAEALPEVVDQGFLELLDTVRQTGQPYVGKRERVVLKREDHDDLEERYLDFIYQPVLRDGAVSGIIVQGHDVTDEVAASEAQRLLINELNHRVKNTLAIVQGLAAQSFRDLPEAEHARRTFDARLNALAAAHSLLVERNWETARLDAIVSRSIAATAGSDISRISLEGPDLSLAPQVAVSLAMIVHELSTNAIKHGALSNDSGRVAVTWTAEPTDTRAVLSIDWRESGGPPVSQPDRRGFGSRLIERGLSSEGGSEVTLSFLPTGLHCHMEARMGEDRMAE